MQRIAVGLSQTMCYRVRRRDLVCFQYSHGAAIGIIRYWWLCLFSVRPQPYARCWRSKPKIQATGNLVGVLEWAPMDAIRPFLAPGEDVLGTAVDIRHKASIYRRTILCVTTECIWSQGNRSRWVVYAGYYTQHNEFRIAAEGTLGFSIVQVAEFLRQQAPNAWMRWRAKPRWRHRVWVWLLRLLRSLRRGGRHHVTITGTTVAELQRKLEFVDHDRPSFPQPGGTDGTPPPECTPP